MLDVLEVEYNWHVAEGITLDRMDGAFPDWIVAQYLDAVSIQLGQETVLVQPGSILIVAPYIAHKYTAVTPFRHHWIHLQGDVALLLERYGLRTEQLYTLDNFEEISHLFWSISMTYHGKDPYRKELLCLKVEELLLRTGIQLRLKEDVHDLGYDRLQNLQTLRSKILEHPEQEWTVANMAASLCISEAYFYSIYRQRFGISPSQDVQNIRIERARIMLRERTPVATTAERCGYHNVYHFIRQFKKKMGVTPGQYSANRDLRSRKSTDDKNPSAP